ncbi:DnaB-like helicase C-terminal domain-containing protein [Gordonia iterans]
MTLLESPEDEQILVGTLISLTNTDTELIDRIDPAHLAGVRATIWETARQLRGENKSATSRAIAAAHHDNQSVRAELQRVAGQSWPAGRIAEAERTVVELGKLRRLQGALTAAQERIGQGSTYAAALEAAHSELGRLEEATQSGVVDFAQAYTDWEHDQNTRPARSHPIPTPWEGLDAVLSGGLRRGRTYIVGARPGGGKAAALDTPIPTPSGWTTMGEIRPGDYVYDEHGRPILVTWESQVWTNRTCYRVSFDDGSSVVVDGEHEWLTDTRQSRKVFNNPDVARVSPFGRDQRWKHAKAKVRTTREIAETLRVGREQRLNHTINTLSAPLEGDSVHSPMDPYVLGVWLGDGSSRAAQFTSADPEIVEEVRKRGYMAEPLSGRYQYSMAGDGTVIAAIRELGLYRNKHIPPQFMRAPEKFRMDLLRGIMDTDGTVGTSGRIELTLCSKTLAMGTVELIRTFGWKVHISESDAMLNGRAVGRRWRIKFSPDQIVFHLPRKAVRQSIDRRVTTSRWYITDVQEVPSVPTKCIEVDSDTHLYLLGESLVPTHNSIAGVNLATYAAQQLHPSLIFSVEMGKLEVTSRVIAGAAAANYGQMTRRDLDDYNWHRIQGWREENPEIPLGLVDRSDIGVEYVSAVCRARKRSHGLDVVFVDYLQLLRPGGGKESRERQIAEMSRALKVLANDLDVAVVIACQLNRNSANEKRPPTLADLRESGSIEQDADVVLLMHHHYQDDGEHSGDVDVVVAKNRTGPLASVRLGWRPHHARFVS